MPSFRTTTAVCSVVGLLVTVGVPGALAVHDAGLLELDGDVADEAPPGAPFDWAGLFTAGGVPVDVGDPLATSAFAPDFVKPDPSFHAGSDKDIDEITTWQCGKVNNPTPKDEILNAYAALIRDGSGGTLLYLGVERGTNNGDSFMGFWFLQNASGCVTPPSGAASWSGPHTPGDLLVLTDLSGGGKVSTIKVLRWDPAAPNHLTLVASAADCADSPPADAVCGRVNDSPILTPWLPRNAPSKPLGTNQFFEAGLDLEDLLDLTTLPCFSTFIAETRTSTSVSAQLKDFAGGRFESCDARISIDPAFATNPVRTSHTFTITVEQDTGSGFVPSPGQSVAATILSGPGVFVDGVDTCTTGTDGTCTVQIASDVPGTTVVAAAVDVVIGTSVFHRETDGTGGSQPGIKLWVCPPSAPNPFAALAGGDGLGLGLAVPSLSLDEAIAAVATSQAGPGTQQDDDLFLTLDVPDPSTVHADVLAVASASSVEDGVAVQSTTAEVTGLDVLGGLVTAGKVRGVAAATASGSASSFSADGSAFEDLVVNGVALGAVAPNTRIDLPAAAFGPGSHVVLFERIGSTSTPSALDGGTYAADLEVAMIRVHVTDLLALVPGDQTADIVVARAVAHADFPQVPLCVAGPLQSVSGDARIAGLTTDPSVAPVGVGAVAIPDTGGLDRQFLGVGSVPDDGSALAAGASTSQSAGSLATTSSLAASFAQIEAACLLAAGGDCTVSASLVRADSSSVADASGATSSGGVVLVGLTIGGTDVCATLGLDDTCQPAPDTVLTIPGVGFVVLNEQVADPAAPGHAGLTVRAMRLVVAGVAELVVAEAHSDATFVLG